MIPNAVQDFALFRTGGDSMESDSEWLQMARGGSILGGGGSRCGDADLKGSCMWHLELLFPRLPGPPLLVPCLTTFSCFLCS